VGESLGWVKHRIAVATGRPDSLLCTLVVALPGGRRRWWWPGDALVELESRGGLLQADSRSLGTTETILAAAAAHHRLVWIHPFLDGRGNLSEENLAEFSRFFLTTCIDQVSCMESLMQPDAAAPPVVDHHRAVAPGPGHRSTSSTMSVLRETVRAGR